MAHLVEPERTTQIVAEADVIVCGGGPAGFAAAIGAARTGAKTALLETHGCLGGVWTVGALSRILEANKPGIMAELTSLLDRRGARSDRAGTSYSYDVEAMKLALEDMMGDAGVTVQLHTRVVAAQRDATNRLTHVITESKSGRQAWHASTFVDSTGDGDVANLAGCGFDYGHPQTGQTQPMSLMVLLDGIHLDEVSDFVAGGTPPSTQNAVSESGRYKVATRNLLAELGRAEVAPSYKAPTMWAIYDDLFALMANHEYGRSALDAADLTAATMGARAEVHRLIAGLRSLGGVWSGMRLVATAEQIGVREGRRIHGRYTVTVNDLRRGARHQDAVCRVTSGADVHALTAAEGGYLSQATTPLQGREAASREVAPVSAYDIPLRALIAKDVDGLMMAGRCISGDFLAHSSYRITGNAVAMGQAGGATAGIAALGHQLPHEVAWEDARRAIEAVNRVGRPVGDAVNTHDVKTPAP